MPYSGVATWEHQTVFNAALSANFPDILEPEKIGDWESTMHDAGTIPFLHAMFKTETLKTIKGISNRWTPMIPAIADGDFDNDIRIWLEAVKTLTDRGYRFVVVPYPEMNGNWTRYGAVRGDTKPELSVAAFRRFVDIGRELGLTRNEILWCWAPNDTGEMSIADFYPGDAWVDIVGGSVYNWGGLRSWSSWMHPASIIDRYVDDVRSFTDRPVVVTQTGCGAGDARAPQWLDDLVTYTAGGRIEGFIWFDIEEFRYEPGYGDFNARVSPLESQPPVAWFTDAATGDTGGGAVYDVDQAGWGSTKQYQDGTVLPWNPDKWVLHWGGNTDPDPPAGDTAWTARWWEEMILRDWQRYHIEGRGWTDIAYNYAVGNSGTVYRLRGENRSGATSGDFDGDGIPENEEAVAVVWIGGTAGTPTRAAYDSMRRLLNTRPSYRITVHSDHKATSCPGDDWRSWVDGVPVGGFKMRTIRQGDGYEATADLKATVKAAQIMLAHHGYADQRTVDRRCKADGFFGAGTKAAVQSFQASRVLIADGVVGEKTWRALTN